MLIVLAVFTTELATNIYLPAMPDLAEFFQVEEEIISLTLSSHLAGLCISGVLYGPLADAFGRKPIVIWSLVLFIFGTFACFLAADIPFLIGARFIQGLGGSATYLIGIVMMKDVYEDKKCSELLSLVYMMIALAPGVAPVLGGYITDHIGWRWTFGAVLILGMMTLIALMCWMNETLKPQEKVTLSWNKTLVSYKDLLFHPLFFSYSMISACVYAGLWAFLNGAPFLYNDLGVGAVEYGWYQAAIIFAYICGTYFNKRSVYNLGIDKSLLVGLLLFLLGTVSMTAMHLLHLTSPLMITMTMLVCSVGLGITFANTTVRALGIFPRIKGASSAILGFLETLTPILTVYLVSQFYNETILPIALVMMGCGVVSLLLYSAINSSNVHEDDMAQPIEQT